MTEQLELPFSDPSLPTVIVVGGGFAGIDFVRNLTQQVNAVVIDRANFHTFQPLLYQVATGALEPGSIAYPLRKTFIDRPDTIFRMATVESVDPASNLVTTDIGAFKYDYLVLALGTETNYFGNESVAKNSLALKKVSDAIDLRSAILSRLEHAVSLPPEQRAAFTTFVIAGGGPTGVELAGALAELRRSVIPADYPELVESSFRILLVDGGERLLGAMSEKSSQAAAKFMKDNGIEVYQDILVKEYDGHIAKLSNGDDVPTHTVVWAAGVRAIIPPGINPEKIERGSGRVRVDQSNKIEGYKNIFAIGDIAQMSTAEKPRGDPMLAPVAKQQGYHLARNFPRLLEDRSLIPFKYKDKGVLAVLGRNHAVAEIGKIAFDGFIAWMLWLFVHVMFLVGFRNRLIVMFEWGYNYFTYDRVIRIIVRPLSKAKL